MRSKEVVTEITVIVVVLYFFLVEIVRFSFRFRGCVNTYNARYVLKGIHHFQSNEQFM